MAQVRPFLFCWLVVAAAVAGCADDGTTQTLLGPGGQIPEGATVLEGLVTDGEYAPLAGATVAVGDLAVTSDEAGAFLLLGLPGGVQTVEVTADGYAAATEEVRIREGARNRVEFLLERLASNAAYVEHLTFTGFEACGWFLGVSGSTGETMQNGPLGLPFGVPCQFGQPKTSYPANVSETWRYLVMEMTWNTPDNMWLLATHQAGVCGTAGESVCWAQNMGRSPLRLEGAPDSEEHARKYALDGKKRFPNGTFDLVADTVYVGLLREEVNNTAGPQCVTAIQTALGPLGQSWNPNLGCGLGYGYSTGYPFTYYISIFHNEPPADPAAYSGLPDA